MDEASRTLPKPRVRMYPHHVDYSAMAMEFRPFAMYMHGAGYRSPSVNTDEFGLRVQYLGDGRVLDLRNLKNEFDFCDVMIGNSTLFGVDCSSDSKTISHFINASRAPGFQQPPVINLGIRGATSQQEIVVFQSLRRFMPKIRKIVIFSGILGATSIALPNTFIHSDFGIISEEAYNLELFAKQYKLGHMDELDGALHRFHNWIDLRLRMNRWLEKLVVQFFGQRGETPAAPSSLTQDEKTQIVMDLFANDLNNWAALARGLGAELSFVLQPAINWTKKPLTRQESELFEVDMASGYYLERYATPDFYVEYRKLVAQASADANVAFFDANEWLNDPSLASETVFVDVCHLTDRGNKIVADALLQNNVI